MEMRAQKQVLKKNEKFQGEQADAEDIPEDVLKKQMNGEILCDIFIHRKTQIGKPLPEHDKSCYLDRMLFINDKITMEKLKSLAKHKPNIYLCISGAVEDDIARYVSQDQIALIPKEHNLKDKWVVLFENQLNFKDMCEEISKQAKSTADIVPTKTQGSQSDPIIYWLHKEENCLKLKSATGSLGAIRKVLDTNDSSTFSENEVIENQVTKFVVITGEPGMGKSSLLLSLTHKIKLKDPKCWVIFINLYDCFGILAKILKPDWDNDTLLNFLYEASKITDILEKFIFKVMLFHHERVVLLIDSYDEISPTYEGQVHQLFNALNRSKVKQVWVTTRTHLQLLLEDKFNTLAYSLQKLSTNDQAHLLKILWNSNESTVSRIERFKNNIDKNIKGFLDNPLHCRMLAEIYADGPLSEYKISMNITTLYQTFVEKKHFIYSVKRKDDPNTPGYKDKLKNEMAFHETVYGTIALQNLFPKYAKTLPALENVHIKEIERYGIMRKGSEKQQFVHQTFTEYFAAMFLCKQIKQKQDKNLIEFLSEIMFKKENDALRIFIDQKLAENQAIFQSIIMHDEENFQEVLNTTGAISQARDDLGRNALHVAAAYGSWDIFKMLSCSKQIDMTMITQRDKLKGIPMLYLSFNALGWLAKRLASTNQVKKACQSGNLRSLRLAINVALERGTYPLVERFLKSLPFESVCSLLRLDNYKLLMDSSTINVAMFDQLIDSIYKSFEDNESLWDSFRQFKEKINRIINYANIAKFAIVLRNATLLQLVLQCASKSQWRAIWKICSYQRVFSERLDAGDYKFCKILLENASKPRVSQMLENSNFVRVMKYGIERKHWPMIKLIKYANQDLKDAIFNQSSYIETFKNSILENNINGFALYKIANERHQKAMMLSYDFQKCFNDAFGRENWKMALALYEHSSNSAKCYGINKLNSSTTFLTQKFASNVDITLLSLLIRCLTFENDSQEMTTLKTFLYKTSNILKNVLQPSNDVTRLIPLKSIINNAIYTKNGKCVKYLLSHLNKAKWKGILKKIDHVALAYEAIYEKQVKVLNGILTFIGSEQLHKLIPTVDYIQIAKDAFYRKHDCNMLEIALRYAHSQNVTIFDDEELLEAVKLCCSCSDKGYIWEKKMHLLLKYALDHQWVLILTNTRPQDILTYFKQYDHILSDYKIKALSGNKEVLAAAEKSHNISKFNLLVNLLSKGSAGSHGKEMLLDIFHYKTAISLAIGNINSCVMALDTIMNSATEDQRREAIACLNVDDIIKDAQSGKAEAQLAALTISRYIDVEHKQRIIHDIDYKSVYKINEPHTAAVLRETLEEEHWKEILKETDFSGSPYHESESRVTPGDEDNSSLPINLYALDCLIKYSSDDQRRMLIHNDETWTKIPCYQLKEGFIHGHLLFKGMEVTNQIFHPMVKCMLKTLDCSLKSTCEKMYEAKNYVKMFKELLRESQINEANVMLNYANETLQKDMLYYFVQEFSKMKMPMCSSDVKVKLCLQILKDYQMEEQFLEELDLPKIFQDCIAGSSMNFLNAVYKYFNARMKSDVNDIVMKIENVDNFRGFRA